MFAKKSLIFGTLLGILTAGSTACAQGEGDKFVRDSLDRLLMQRTIECDIRIETVVDGKGYAAWGHYAEQVLPQATSGTFLRSQYRLEINFPMNSPVNTPAGNDLAPNQMTLVCRVSADGGTRQIEQYTFIEGTKLFRTIDLNRLEDRLKTAQREVFFSQVSEVRNLGGLTGKMRQISRFYEFALPAQEDLQEEETIPALKLIGTLRRVYHKELLTQFGGLDKQGRYPSDFPSDIELWLGRHNDFPYKIRYLRRTSEKSEQKTLLLQESYYNVVLNGPPIPDSKFSELTVSDDVVRKTDETDTFIRALGL